jgi:putative ABC transport system permease protein
MGALWKDIPYSLRMLRNRPIFTTITALSLALGIGANSAIFSVVNAVLLRPLPYLEPERLVMLSEYRIKSSINWGRVAPDNFHEWQKNNRVFDEIAAVVALDQLTLTGSGGADQVYLHQVSANFFPMLGVQPELGRVFSQKEDMPHTVKKEEAPHGDRVVILSHGLWQRRFGGDPGVLGTTINIDGEGYAVIGVMPPGFKFNEQAADLWTPLGLDPAKGYSAAGFGRFLGVLARLKPGVTVEQAQAEMNVIAGQLQQRDPVLNAGVNVDVRPLYLHLIRKIRQTLFTLFGAVFFVLLIACANVANLRLAQAAAREREMAIRASLGASRRRLIRLLLTENLILAALGGVLGLLLAFGLVKLLVALGPANIPRLSELDASPLDGSVLGFTLLISLLAGIVSGLAPAWHASTLDLNKMLKEGGRSAMSSARSAQLRSLFIVAEIALALVLLIGCGLMIRSFLHLQATDPGFNPRNLLTMQLLLPPPAYLEGPKRTAFFEQMIQRIEAIPGVESASVVSILPLSTGPGGTGFSMSFMIEGVHALDQPNKPGADVRLVNSNFFKTMGVPLKMGRDFTQREITEKEARVVIINETMARQFFLNESPLGRRVRLNRPTEPLDEIIGVVGDIKITDFESEIRPTIYWPHKSWAFAFGTVLVRTTVDPAGLSASVTREIHELDPVLAIANIRTMEQVLWRSIARPRFNTLLLTVLAAVALALAVMGIYGVISYTVSQRMHEIGVRIALGAQKGDVLKLILKHGMKSILAGVGVGLAASFALTRALSGLLYAVKPTDPATFIGVSLLLSAVALLACYIPARRATKLDPWKTLRHD